MIQLPWVQKYEKNDRHSFRYRNFFDNYKYTRLCIHFYWISHNNIQYINFEYIILAPQKILVKIHHCSSQPMCMHVVGRPQNNICVCTQWDDLKSTYVYARSGPTSKRPMCIHVLGQTQNRPRCADVLDLDWSRPHCKDVLCPTWSRPTYFDALGLTRTWPIRKARFT